MVTPLKVLIKDTLLLKRNIAIAINRTCHFKYYNVNFRTFNILKYGSFIILWTLKLVYNVAKDFLHKNYPVVTRLLAAS